MSKRGPINPLALPIADAAQLLSKAGGRVIRAEQIEADVAAGAPTNGDGTINLVTYAAWLSGVRSQEIGVRRKSEPMSDGADQPALQTPDDGLPTHAD